METMDSQPNWSDLQPELLELIVSKLSIINKLSFKEVCSSWHRSAQNSLSSPSQTPHLLEKPLLMFPSRDEEGDKDSVRLFSFEHKSMITKLRNIPKVLYDSRCVGSSHGWLLLLDENADPLLLNPLSQVQIQLPKKQFLRHTVNVSSYYNINDCFMVEYKYKYDQTATYIETAPLKCHRTCLMIHRAVLSSNPCHNNYRVLIIYGNEWRLAYFTPGDTAWTDIEGEYRAYWDITHYDHTLFALSEGCFIEAWDFHGSFPVKTMHIRPHLPVEFPWENGNNLSKWYLVETSGDLLIVVRHITEYYLGDEEITPPSRCPYLTLYFRVYKLEFDQRKWIEVNCLRDCALFLGINQSMSVSTRDFPGCEANSIYFTDDYWDQTCLDQWYRGAWGGGHDMGVFNLKDGLVKRFYAFDQKKIEIPPFWIVPSPQ